MPFTSTVIFSPTVLVARSFRVVESITELNTNVAAVEAPIEVLIESTIDGAVTRFDGFQTTCISPILARAPPEP